MPTPKKKPATKKPAAKKPAARKPPPKKPPGKGTAATAPPPPPPPPMAPPPAQPAAARASSYDDYRDRQAAVSRGRSEKGREVGPLPGVADPVRRARCRLSLRLFAETYTAPRFPLAWGADHIDLIDDLQRVVLDGGQQAEAHPRGSGKTTLCEVAALWALLYGHRRYLMLVGATEKKAEELLDNIKAEVEANDLLADDFPEVCHPVRMLEGINNRANGQTVGGVRTRIEWGEKIARLPAIAGSASCGAIVQVAGITGSVRGAAKMVGGEKLRPDLVIIDDPQTDESARSPSQNLTRETVLSGAILGLAGPGKKIAAVMPCTVIRPGDMADLILDRGRHPEWHGRRCRLMRSMPGRLDLWEQYGELLRDGLRRDPPDRAEANRFYAERRADMDAGATPSWPARFNPDQLSAVQYALDLYLLDRRTFLAEYQNDPAPDDDAAGAEPLDPAAVMARLNRHRGARPRPRRPG
jgi:hypothetical protein